MMKRLTCLLLTILFVASMLTGCAGTGNVQNSPQSTAGATSKPAANAGASANVEQQPEQSIPALPFEEPLKISVYERFDDKYVGTIEKFEDMPFYKWLADQVHIEWSFTSPSAEVYTEQFGLMIASHKWPDVIVGMGDYPGTDIQAYQDGVICSLNQYMDEGYMPNLSRFYSEFPKYEQMVRKSSGEFLDFPYIVNDSGLLSNGLVIRKDVLDALNLEIPQTIDEWDTVLRAFKDQTDLIPFTVRTSDFLNSAMPFVSAWGMVYFEYQEDGVVRYGAVQEGFRDYLKTMNRWYEDGLLDPDYLTMDSSTLTAKVSAGLVGSYSGAAGGNLQNPWYAILEEDVHSPIEYAGAPIPVLKKGDTAKISPKGFAYTKNRGMYITTACQDPARTAMALDYIYSEKANKALLWGVEGENYQIDPDGRVNRYQVQDGVITDMMESWKPSHVETPSGYINGIIDYENKKIWSHIDENLIVPKPLENASELDLAKNHVDQVRMDALNLWLSVDPVNKMPDLTYTTEESSRRNEIYSVIQTYVYENVTNFIIGARSLDEFDAFTQEVWALGLQDALDIAQQELDAYNNK